jgi:2-methylcitrate dehydratase PrpD
MHPMLATAFARWAEALEPTEADLALADAALRDTLAVAHAARDHPLLGRAGALGEAGREAVAAHVLDYDDLHLPSTTHISAVCVPVARAAGGGARTYLAAAGVMARLGTALGWRHYERGWHATCTAGTVAAAAGAALARGADVATAMALAVPAAGGVQRAFGTDAKALQVGLAVDAGLRAAELAAAGASADPSAVDQWLELLGGGGEVDLGGPAVPGGLAIKVYPCCYALQRPIAATRALAARPERFRVTTPESSVQPLIHGRPRTGLEGKFSLEYGIAAALLDGAPGLGSFTDAAVARPEAQALIERIDVELTPGGDGLLAGAFTIGDVTLELAPDGDEATKLELCGATHLAGTHW